MTEDESVVIGIRAIAFMAAEDDLLEVFCKSSGLSPKELRACLEDPNFLASVLAFLLQDDGWTQGFCVSEGMRPADVAAAHALLSGGPVPNWT